MNASSRIGSNALAVHSRSVLTRLPRQPTTGVSTAVASIRSAGFHSTPVAARDDFAAEADGIAALAALELPGIAVRQPGLGQFDLPAVVDALAEHAVHIADAVAVGGDVERREAFHEAGRQPAEAAVAQRRVGLELLERGEAEAAALQRLLEFAGQAHVGQRVAQQPPDEELETEVIDPLAARGIGPPGRFHPPFDDFVAQRQDRGVEPVVRGGGEFVLAGAVPQDVEDVRVELCDAVWLVIGQR